jgi:hypothetical protein
VAVSEDIGDVLKASADLVGVAYSLMAEDDSANIKVPDSIKTCSDVALIAQRDLLNLAKLYKSGIHDVRQYDTYTIFQRVEYEVEAYSPLEAFEKFERGLWSSKLEEEPEQCSVYNSAGDEVFRP